MVVCVDLVVDIQEEAARGGLAEPQQLSDIAIDSQTAQSEAEGRLLGAFKRLRRRVNYHFGDFQYLARVNITLRGRPRVTLVTTLLELDRRWLARNWRECGGTRVRNYRQLHSNAEVLEACGFNDTVLGRASRAKGRRKMRWTRRVFDDLKDEGLSERPHQGIYVPGVFPRAMEYKWVGLLSAAVKRQRKATH